MNKQKKNQKYTGGGCLLTENKTRFFHAILMIVLSVLLCIAGFFSFNIQKKQVSGATIGSLTLANYETRTDGNIFDGYEMSKLFEALTGQANATIATVESLPAMTSNDIRTANGGNNIVVQIAGKSWYATYLSKSGNDSILTLWRTAPDFKAAFAPYSSGSISSNYPSAMYGMSKMRSVELNNGGNYANSSSSTLSAVPSSTHIYAAFTVPGIAGSLTDYIVTPAAMAWQADRKSVV